ncbi:MAG: YlbF family regulator [Oscillospiraceae bacterium]|nr:YlbF family regulator [Oscillospiraceae bacterium]
MDVIRMAKDLGKAIQADDRYLAMRLAMEANDNDEELQAQIGEFNLKRMALNQEIQKEERDQEKMNELDKEIKTLYGAIMGNPKMVVFTSTKQEMDSLMNFINQILVMSVNGEDPETAEMNETSCTGSCSSCSGCH